MSEAKNYFKVSNIFFSIILKRSSLSIIWSCKRVSANKEVSIRLEELVYYKKEDSFIVLRARKLSEISSILTCCIENIIDSAQRTTA